MSEYYLATFRFPLDKGVRTVLEELVWLTSYVCFLPVTLKFGDDRGRLEGTFIEHNCELIVDFCEKTEAVKIDYGTIWKVVHEEVDE